jgi:hypothetical protein
MTELEEQITAFIVEETGRKRKRVLLASRLAQDIGMDGDDAVEFFKKFGEKFHVDLTALYGHWGAALLAGRRWMVTRMFYRDFPLRRCRRYSPPIGHAGSGVGMDDRCPTGHRLDLHKVLPRP